MQALILGATGATGQTLTQQLLADARFQSVTVFARRELALAHDKLTTHIVDFRQPETWQDKVRGDVLFSCLGTTIKAAGSQEAMWAIDHDLQLAFAQAAQRQRRVALCVGVGADGGCQRPHVLFAHERRVGAGGNGVGLCTHGDFAPACAVAPR